MLSREPQKRRQRSEVVEDTGDRAGVLGLPSGRELLGASVGLGDGGVAGLDVVGQVEDLPEAGLDLVGSTSDTFAVTLRTRWIRQRWRRLSA